MMQLIRPIWEFLILILANLLSQAPAMKMPGFYPYPMPYYTSYCLSWRVGVEANNVRYFHTVPPQCVTYIENYMLGGQYNSDVGVVIQQIFAYLDETVPSDDGKDAWIFDVDDTCLSNVMYYGNKRFGGVPYDPMSFKSWAERGMCPAIPAVLGLYRRLLQSGYKVFLITGRDEVTLRLSTTQNLFMQGFLGYEKLIMRNPLYRGMGAAMFKSSMRKQLVDEGYRIRGNIGDQWSDLMGDCSGDRTFKLPNPMYFVP
ncbi:uncharacterized protein A4U43_C07F7370 [Asparagus officinalis]|uniref:Acid phosphatase n=1 Tax=Asparagus officinalis TaxID=4686 RepID=A0A5P1EBZ2_ASPOF|nr:acid phosphatase 1 [Asparagus officinalis]XP_020276712.1 acid phosphatase 1 [Asparagus officinalis]ONK62717.1 uncharacterized protein A4U43_C07F7370 [Asparagus officinalis]